MRALSSPAATRGLRVGERETGDRFGNSVAALQQRRLGATLSHDQSLIIPSILDSHGTDARHDGTCHFHTQ